MLILISGLPATGKSTIAKNLAKKIKASVIRTDVIRKELFKTPKYTREEKELVYNVTFLIAAYLLEGKRNVIIDGTFYKRHLRKRVYQIAEKTGCRMEIIECICPEYIIQRRMTRRNARKNAKSDADYKVYKKIKKEYQPIKRQHIIIDTSDYIKKNIEDLVNRLGITR